MKCSIHEKCQDASLGSEESLVNTTGSGPALGSLLPSAEVALRYCS